MAARDECIDALYEQVRREVPITRTAYGNSLYGWEIEPVMIDGERIGVFIRRGTEVHIHLAADKALMHARRVIRQHIASNLKALGHLTTRSTSDPKAIRFLRRLGFYRVGEDGTLSVFRLDTLKIQ